MPRYYFHLYNDEEIRDEEGTEHPNQAIALQRAADAARHMAAESVRETGARPTHSRLRRDGTEVGTVYFRDVLEVQG